MKILGYSKKRDEYGNYQKDFICFYYETSNLDISVLRHEISITFLCFKKVVFGMLRNGHLDVAS